MIEESNAASPALRPDDDPSSVTDFIVPITINSFQTLNYRENSFTITSIDVRLVTALAPTDRALKILTAGLSQILKQPATTRTVEVRVRGGGE